MIPSKARFLPKQKKHFSTFDPCAASMLNELLKISGARLVISSCWRYSGLQACQTLLQTNGIDPENIHQDWRTTRGDTRTLEIKNWLLDHPEITNYVVLDDELLDSKVLPGFVQCDTDEGMSYRNFIESKNILGIATDGDRDTLRFLQRKEVWRTQRKGDVNESLTWEYANTLFPVVEGLPPHMYRGH
ncbi:HAD domain-containing protein [Candidatus Dojkabacteria bacterium]|jgi:hypothetical protein|nr:HAD domain-containing protein [Candidatus Dojkabacteria bacterium]